MVKSDVMKSLWRIMDILSVVFNVRFWMTNYEYSSGWDDEINKLMSEFKFSTYDYNTNQSLPGDIWFGSGDHYTSYLNDVEIWTSNHPHASFTIKKDGHTYRPSRLTILRAHRKLLVDRKNEKTNFPEFYL